jgi:hypothetical protein
MQGLEVKGLNKLNAVLKSLPVKLPEARGELNQKIAVIVRKETAENRAEALAIQEAQKYADEIADKLEGAG